MRNLKRALSLALATVMTMGMMVVGSSASYADVDSSYNQEAINVAQAVGIMTGDENGNFNPDNGVTRNEMAVIMCNLLDLQVGDSTSPFTDVDSWAAPYVAACYNNGIVSGTSATTYGGNNSVTSAQAALMVMKALGYFGYQGEFGQDWKVAVTKQANKVSLFDDIDAYVDQALTRNEVAQLVLNALESTVQIVTEEGGVNVATGDVTVNVQPSYKYEDVKLTSYDYSNSTDKDINETQQLCEKLYGRDLVKNGGNTDELGRPGSKWTYKGEEVISTDTPDVVYTDAVELKTIYADLNLSKAETFSIYLNGQDSTGDAYVNVTIDSKKGDTKINTIVNPTGIVADKTFLNAKSGDKKIGGAGYILEFYVDNDQDLGHRVTGIAYTQFLAKASADYNTEDESVGITVYGDVNVTELKSEDFEGLESVKEDDYLLITAAYDGTDWKAMSVAYPQVVSSVTATGSKQYDNVTANGTTYKFDLYTSNINGQALGHDKIVASAGLTLDHDYDLYLNSYGYVVGIDDASSSADLNDIVFVKDASTSGFNVIAKLVFMSDGTSKTVTINDVDDEDAQVGNAAAAGYLTKNQFYTYTEKSNGEYDLDSISVNEQTYKTLDKEVKTGTVKFATATNGTALAADGETVYVHDDRYSVGVKNSPTMKSGTVVYVLYDDTDYNIRAVFTRDKGKITSSADQYVYILGSDGKSYDGDDYYYTYNVIVDGEKTKMNFSDDIALTVIDGSSKTETSVKNGSLTKGLYKVEGYDDDYVSDMTYYVSTDKVDDKEVNVLDNVAKKSINYNNGSLTIKGTDIACSVADDAVLYAIDKTNSDKLTVLSSGSQLNSLSSGTYRVYVVMDDDADDAEAIAIYAVRVAE